jgi:uncharacterized protein (DUF488 family)
VNTIRRIVYTLGHSTRSLQEFFDILSYYGVELVIDVRRWPTSRRFPWFRKEVLEKELREKGYIYLWMGDVLGGYRRIGIDVPEGVEGASCFTSEGFRAYALYVTLVEDAWRAVLRLEELARQYRTVIICKERLPWRCHRKILADILELHGFKVKHVIEKGRVIPHRLSRCVKLRSDGRAIYE